MSIKLKLDQPWFSLSTSGKFRLLFPCHWVHFFLSPVSITDLRYFSSPLAFELDLHSTIFKRRDDLLANTYKSLFGSTYAAQPAHQHGTPDPALARHVVSTQRARGDNSNLHASDG